MDEPKTVPLTTPRLWQPRSKRLRWTFSMAGGLDASMAGGVDANTPMGAVLKHDGSKIGAMTWGKIVGAGKS